MTLEQITLLFIAIEVLAAEALVVAIVLRDSRRLQRFRERMEARHVHEEELARARTEAAQRALLVEFQQIASGKTAPQPDRRAN